MKNDESAIGDESGEIISSESKWAWDLTVVVLAGMVPIIVAFVQFA